MGRRPERLQGKPGKNQAFSVEIQGNVIRQIIVYQCANEERRLAGVFSFKTEFNGIPELFQPSNGFPLFCRLIGKLPKDSAVHFHSVQPTRRSTSPRHLLN